VAVCGSYAPATQWRLVLWVVGKLGGIAAGGQGDTISDNVITPMGRAFFTGNSYRPDFSSDSYLSQELLIHELGHCWQYYNGIDVVKRVIASYSSVSPEGFGDSSGEGGALGSDNVNDATYVIKLNATNTAGARALVDNFGIEQQGTVFEAYYRYHILNRPDRVSNDHSSVINVPRIQLLVEDAMK
jgi:hypothetical protein